MKPCALGSISRTWKCCSCEEGVDDRPGRDKVGGGIRIRDGGKGRTRHWTMGLNARKCRSRSRGRRGYQ